MAISIKEEFVRYSFISSQLEKFGFRNSSYCYYEADNTIKITITIKDNDVLVDAFDNENNEPFYNLKNSKLLQSSISLILKKIKKECCTEKNYISDQANRINQYIFDTYSINPDHLFKDYPHFGIYRNDKGKWFGIIMNLDNSKLDKNKKGEIEIINLKTEITDTLINNISIYPSYHMNKKHWISVILNDSLSDKEIFNLIDKSYALIKCSK